MKTGPVSDILDAYGISDDQWTELRGRADFQAAVLAAHEELKKEGMSFKMKARLQAEELLKRSWEMIHEPDPEVVPANVRADLIKFTIRAAGLDGSKDQGAAGQQNALQININLGG